MPNPEEMQQPEPPEGRVLLNAEATLAFLARKMNELSGKIALQQGLIDNMEERLEQLEGTHRPPVIGNA